MNGDKITLIDHHDNEPLHTGHSSQLDDKVKIRFPLTRGPEGYPPVEFETLWATPAGDGYFAIDNIPFFVVGVSCFDIVQARHIGNKLYSFEDLVIPKGHSTLRVLFYETTDDTRPVLERARDLIRNLRTLGCTSEISHIPDLISVDVPPEVELARVRNILDAGNAADLWEYEEATLAT